MNRTQVLATLLAIAAGTGAASGQALVQLRISVTLSDAAGSTPVPQHVLLISDNPASSPPRRIVTRVDGTAEVSLRPGSYTVESDEPVAFRGKGYQWVQIVELKAGRNAVLALTADNAEIGGAPATSLSSPSAPVSVENSPSLLLAQWQNSIVSIWTSESRATGFVADAATGLVVTTERAIGSASAAEVQFTPELKVGARVLATDATRDVAVLWIDPATAATMPALPLKCADESRPILIDRQPIVVLSSPFHGGKDVVEGELIRANPRLPSVASFRLESGGSGGPVFNTGGSVVGLSAFADEADVRRRDDVRVVPVDAVCGVIKSAMTTMQTAPKPAATRLPVEPPAPSTPPAPVRTTRASIQLTAYQVSSAGFDILFLPPAIAAASDFGDWSEYFLDTPPVLAVRVTPRLTESIWTTIGRMAASTQGAVIPPIKHFRPGFSRMQAFCGEAEVTPIHPFTLARRVSETDAIREGLYIFDPQAFGPHCKSVRVVVYSEKEPNKPDPKVIDPSLIERVWNDFAKQKG